MKNVQSCICYVLLVCGRNSQSFTFPADMRHRVLLAVPKILTNNASIVSVMRLGSVIRVLLLLVSIVSAISFWANDAIHEQIKKIEQVLTHENTGTLHVSLAGKTEKYEVRNFSMLYCGRISTFSGGNLSLSCNQDKTRVTMMLVRLNVPASAVRSAYKRGSLLSKTEKKDFSGWIRQTDSRYFSITQPTGLNKMLSLGKGLSAKNSLTMALYADHVHESDPQQAQKSIVSRRPGSTPLIQSTKQRSASGDLICRDLPYKDTADLDTYGQPYILEAEIGSDRAKLQLRCNPDFREIQAVRIVMDNKLAQELSHEVQEQGTAVVKFRFVELADEPIVSEWTYRKDRKNQIVFSPKRRVDEHEIHTFFADAKAQTMLIKLAFVDDAVSMAQALESASALPIILLDKSERRNRNLDHVDDGW